MLARRDDVALRLFAFPHAGGNHGIFGTWAAGLAADVEIVSYTLPGRTLGRDRPPYATWDRLADDLTELVAAHLDGTPFAFFGHSFGALAAFEVCRRLAAAGLRTPDVLLLSAHRAPHVPAPRERHSLPEERLLGLIREWGLVPDELLADEELLRRVVTPLRADLKLDDDYPCGTGRATGRRLTVPCVVYGGAEDRTALPRELEEWREHVDPGVAFDTEILPGGHFYTVDSQAALLRSIGARLDRVRSTVGPSVAVAGAPYPAPERGVWTRFREQVAAHPEATALIDRPRQWSYRELDDHATALASDLAALGVTQGDVVGLLLPPSAEYCASLLTCFGIGAPACLLEKNWPPSLLRRFLESAGVEVVVTVPELLELLPPPFRVPGRVLVLDRDRDRTEPDAARQVGLFPRIAPSDIALISMTSGTSGTPKAVRNTHLGCLYCFDGRYGLYPYRESSREGLNAFFAWECLRPLLQGRTAVVIPDDHIVDPVRLVATIEESGITRAVVPPSLFESLLDNPTVGPTLAERLGHMEIWFLMGEVVPTRIVDKAAALLPAHVRVVNSYSTWECLDVSFADLVPRPAAEPTRSLFAPVGHILSGSAAILLNSHGEPVPRGGVGELHFAGPGVADGYLDDPVKTAERFVPCPPALAASPFAEQLFYRTGDRARFLPDGAVEILGRTGDTVKVRGFKVSLRSVEHVLEDQAGVSRAIVRPVLDDRTGQPTGLLAYLLGDGGMPSATVLARSRRKARLDLPEYARPRHVIGIDALPISRNDSHKIDFSALPPPPDDLEVPPVAGALTSMEHRVAQAWQDVLGARSLGPDDNFFEVGGDSLGAARLSGVLAERYGIALAVVDVFQFSTVREMAGHCSAGEPPGAASAVGARRPRRPGTARLAVVGMAGRFPGAPDIDTFWANLRNGVDSLTTFSAERLREKGVPESVWSHPEWVPAAQLIADSDKFDAGFWGIGHHEAVMMDPQHRVFVEVAWAALEQAGYARRNNPYGARTGVFAACGIDGYLIHHLDGGGLKDPLDPAEVFLTEIGNEKDYIATRVAYLLDLGGPAITVTSACSSALVAVAQAAQSIAAGQCDMAIAGGSSITFPSFGYRYEDGLVGSVDGHVRPFDEAASGTLFGDSVGAVVLKRLDNAIEDGDHVWAVLTGFGVSNDGRMKAGYAAPSARAQSRCISDAIDMAGIDAEQISYVECHATATHVGDAIEIKGLHDAFTGHRRSREWPEASCAIGSVKGNIGHANCAAGITGFIKTVLCLHHRVLVPTVNHANLNPKLVDLVDTTGSPFTVQETRAEWAVADPAVQLPRRAGVSSFGIGGTNAHVILEEAPELPAPEIPMADPGRPDQRSLHLVTVSARSESALRHNADAVARFVEALPADEIAPAVRSLYVSRESHPLRACAVMAPGAAGGLDDLRRLAEQPPRAARRPGQVATVVFCFSGQGSQAAGMARGLYRGRADGGRFRRHFDAACEQLAPHLPTDPAALILGADDTSVMRPITTQCGLFAVEYALARTLLDIGVEPVAVAGHSIGEYPAAVVAGLLGLDEAAALVAARALATEEMAGSGGMLSVRGDEQVLVDWLAERTDLWLAARNAPDQVVLSGGTAALRRAAESLSRLGFTCRPVPVSHPFHSALMAPVAQRLGAAAAGLPTRAPGIPMASNLTGSWIDSRHRPATYWSEHATSTVRWRGDVELLVQWEPDIVLEIGPGSVLTAFSSKLLRHRTGAVPLPVATMPTVRNPDADDEKTLLEVLGELWCHGVGLNVEAFHDGAPRRGAHRPLPAYAFDRTSYWTAPDASVHVDREPAATSSAVSTAGPATEASPWLVRFVDKPDARVTLYCFPYAGGDSGAFRSWAHVTPPWLDLVAIELPGRNGRPGATGATGPDTGGRDDEAVLVDLAASIRSDAGSDAVAFCGLSFGAVLLLDLLGGPLADWARGGRVRAVSVVGRAPVTAATVPVGTIDDAPESYLMAPGELRDDARWTQAVLPVLRADLRFDARSARRVAERWERGGTQVLDSPLQVQCGSEDPSFPCASAADWAAVTTSPVVDVHVHPGSHDFMLRERERILGRLVTFLDRLDPADVPDPDRPAGRLFEVRWVPAAAGTDVAAGDIPVGDIPWTDLATSGPDAVARFLRRHLTGPSSTAAVLCHPAAGDTPERYCARFLELVRPLLDAQARGHLVVVLPAHRDSGVVTGLTRSLVAEEPGLSVHRVHLREWFPTDADRRAERVAHLLRTTRPYAGETDLLRSGGHRLAQRLVPVTLPELPPGTLGGSEGSYLVTGGTGGIGRAVTDWLLQHQGVDPARIVVSGRADPGTVRTGVRAGVRFVSLDLAGPIDEAALSAEIGPLAGMFHLAGVLDDGVVRNLDASRLPAVLAPKLALARLQEIGRRCGAPWIAAFSSTSALLGAPGQANYAAANAWMDAAAMWPDAAMWPEPGPVVVAIDWGTWGEVGMAARSAKALDASRAGGETALRTGVALSLLGKVVASLLGGSMAGRHFAACDLPWSEAPWSALPLASGLPVALVPSRPRPSGAAQPSGAQPDPVADPVHEFLTTYVHQWDESKRLAEMGLDSLDFVRIRVDFAKAFGKDVPLTAIARPDLRLGELHSLLSGS